MKRFYLYHFPNVYVVKNIKNLKIKPTLIELILLNKICATTQAATNWANNNNPKLLYWDVDNRKECVYDWDSGYIGEQFQLDLKG